MALPASGELGGNTVTQAQFKTKIEDLRDEVATKANESGDATKTFKVADATNDDEALSKGQLLAEMKAVDGAGSGLDADTVDGVQGALLGIGGAGYAWIDETANRAINTTYTNTRGKPIIVAVSGRKDTYSYVDFLVDGVLVCINNSRDEDTSTSVGSVSLIVPNNSTYRIEGTDNVTKWFELK